VNGFLLLAALVVAFAILVQLIERRRWRAAGSRLYAQHASLWDVVRPWKTVESSEPEPWRAPAAASARHQLETLGFSFVGHIQNPGYPGNEAPVMAVHLGAEGRIWAACYESAGHEVIEFESAFANGRVVGTSNNEVAGRLMWPPDFDMSHQGFDTRISDLLAQHRARVEAVAALAQVPPVQCQSLQDLIAVQDRQQAAKHAFRAACNYVTDDEFWRIATAARVPRRVATGILREYRRLGQRKANRDVA
jgi:hypothetical protein